MNEPLRTPEMCLRPSRAREGPGVGRFKVSSLPTANLSRKREGDRLSYSSSAGPTS